jgi:hypothetical protein
LFLKAAMRDPEVIFNPRQSVHELKKPEDYFFAIFFIVNLLNQLKTKI